MILFSIIASLIGLAIALLFLPLRLLNLALATILLPVKIIIRLLTRNLFLLAVLIIGVLMYKALHNSRATLPQLTPATLPQEQTMPKGVVIVQPVAKREDGDSAFATDLYAIMAEPERITYSQNYYWAMSNLQDGQVHSWTGGNIHGAIRAIDTFTNNTGGRCRHFSEILKVHTIEQTITGTACAQETGGWCKLKPNATPACGLSGYQPGFFDSIMNLF